MRIGWVVLSLVATLLSIGSSKALAQQEVTIEDVILLAQSDLADGTILVFLDYREIAFSLGATEVLRLRQGGVSEEVIRYLIKRSGAPAELAPEVVSESYPPRYYATYLGSPSNFYVGASYYPYWWWNDYYYLHFSPLHSFINGRHRYLGQYGYVGHDHSAYGTYGGLGTHTGHGSHTTYGYQRVRSFSGRVVSGGDQSHFGSTGILKHPFGHRDGQSSLGSSSGVHSRGGLSDRGRSRSSLSGGRHSGGGHSRSGLSNRGHSRGGYFGGGHSGRGHSGLGSSRGGHSRGGHSGGGHSGGGHSGGGHGGGNG